MKPRRCAHQVYDTSRPRFSATMAASLFSNPASALLENGRLFGTEHIRSPGVASAPAGHASPSPQARTRTARLARGRMAGVLTICAAHLEHQQFAAAGGVERQVLRRTGEAERSIADAQVDLCNRVF